VLEQTSSSMMPEVETTMVDTGLLELHGPVCDDFNYIGPNGFQTTLSGSFDNQELGDIARSLPDSFTVSMQNAWNTATVVPQNSWQHESSGVSPWNVSGLSSYDCCEEEVDYGSE